MKKDCKINKKINKIPQVKIVHSIWLLLQWSWKIGVVPKVKYLYKYIDSCTKMKKKKNHYEKSLPAILQWRILQWTKQWRLRKQDGQRLWNKFNIKI